MLQDLSNRFESVLKPSADGQDRLSSRDLTALNDVFRSYGMEPLPRDADVEDLVCYSIRAIHELGSRALEEVPPPQLSTTMSTRDQHDTCVKNKSNLIQSELALKKLKDEHDATLNENKELRKLVMQWKSESNSLSHLLKCKENELSKLQTVLKDKMAEEDRRSALSMTTIRDQNMPHTSLIVLNNMQKRIDVLEQENAVLSKRNSRRMTHDSDKYIDTVVAQLEQTQAQLAETTTKYYELVEETNRRRKDDAAVTKLLEILGEEPKQALKTVREMQKLVAEIFPPLDAFVTRITRMVDPGVSGPITQAVLSNALNRVVQWAQDSAEYAVLMEARNSGPLTEEERLDLCRLKALESSIRETFGVAETQTDSLVPYLGRVKFKCDEFRNFYKQACIELGLQVKDKQPLPTYAAFMDAFKKGLRSSSKKLIR